MPVLCVISQQPGRVLSTLYEKMRNCSSERLCHLPEVTQLGSVGLSASGALPSIVTLHLGQRPGVPGWCPAEPQLISHN